MIKQKNLHLTVSAIIITIVSLTYGFSPNGILSTLFDFSVKSVDLNHVFRAMMGLYLGMVTLWVIGIFRSSYWRAATISNVFFMLGLALGRVISLVVDGIPSVPFSVGLVLELALAFWGIKNLKKYAAALDR